MAASIGFLSVSRCIERVRNMLTCTGHYPVIGGGSVAIDWVWQLHPWLTVVIRGVSLTDKMADKAADKLAHQNLDVEVAPFTFNCGLYSWLPVSVHTPEYSFHLAPISWQVWQNIFRFCREKGKKKPLPVCLVRELDEFISAGWMPEYYWVPTKQGIIQVLLYNALFMR